MKKYDNYIKFLEINLLILPHRDINRLSQWQGAIASNNFQKFVLIFVEKKRDKISLPTLSICLNDQFLASSIRFGKAKSAHLKDSINKIGFRHRESNPGLLGESQLSWPLDHAGLMSCTFFQQTLSSFVCFKEEESFAFWKIAKTFSTLTFAANSKNLHYFTTIFKKKHLITQLW